MRKESRRADFSRREYIVNTNFYKATHYITVTWEKKKKKKKRNVRTILQSDISRFSSNDFISMYVAVLNVPVIRLARSRK